jgi:hypothetical protein
MNAYRLLVGKITSKIKTQVGRWILERYDGVVWTGLVWLRIKTSGELL